MPAKAALHGASGATRPSMECSQRHRTNTHRLISWRVTELYGAQRRQRRRRCREDCVLWGYELVSDRLEVQNAEIRRHCLCRRRAALHGTSGATRPPIECPRRRRASTHRLISWRVTELYGAQRRRRRRRCRVLASAFQSGSSRSQSSDSARC